MCLQGSSPFDDRQGWYRAFRGLAGAVGYSCARKGWHPRCHCLFPPELRACVRAMLLCHNQGGGPHCSHSKLLNGESGLQVLPLHVIYFIMEFMVRTVRSTLHYTPSPFNTLSHSR